MSRGRFVLASSFLALVVLAGAVPPTAVEESLELTSATSVATAIDQGAAGPLSGVLPTSEAYQRAAEVVAGLKAGAPAPAPALDRDQLAALSALSEGAVRATVQSNAGTATNALDRAALRAFAQGYLRGALDAATPLAGPGPLAGARAAAEGAFRGVVEQVTTGEPRLSAQQHEAYARALARETLQGLALHADVLVAASGSPALADVATWSAAVVRTHVQTLPVDATSAQLAAVGTFGGAELQSLLVGVVGEFPTGVPSPQKADLRAWADGLARGHQGTPPWAGGSLPMLAAYAREATLAGIVAVKAARADAAGPGTQGILDAVSAWGGGMARGGLTHLAATPDHAGDLRDDAAAYANAVATPGIDLLLGLPAHASPDPDAVAAYAEGLTGGLDDLGQATTAAAALFPEYATGLADAVTRFPPDVKPAQVRVLEAFAEGATDRVHQRLTAIQLAAVSGEDAVFLDAFARGLADGAAEVARATGPVAPPALANVLLDGVASGFLGTRDPQALWTDIDGYEAATRTWVASAVPAALLGPLANATLDGTDATAGAVRAWAVAVGAAPTTWIASKGRGLTPEAFNAKNDLLWLGAFAQEATNETLALTLDPQGGVRPDEVARVQAAITVYVARVAANATALPIDQAARALSEGNVGAAARRFAEAVAAPAAWIDPRVAGTQAAADAALGELVSNATTVTRFVNSTYARGVVTMLDALGEGMQAGAEEARRSAEARAGDLGAPWAQGVVDAVLAAPIPVVQSDLENRAAWVAALTVAAVSTGTQATDAQKNATRAYAHEVVTWALKLRDDPVPDVTGIPTPLAAWAEATVGTTLARLPPGMSEAEQDAVVAYAAGVARAIQDLPTPDASAWTPAQLAAMAAYVTGVQSGVALVKSDVQALQNATLCDLKLSQECPTDDGGEEPPACEGDCPPPCTEDCPGEAPCRSLKSCPEKVAAAYAQNLGSWSENVTRAGLRQMPDVSPTQAGITAVTRWAGTVLAGSGVVVNLTEPSVLPDGPRGPVWDFATARPGDVQAFAEAVAQGYAPLAELPAEPDLQRLVGLADPVTRWAQAITQVSADHYIEHAPGYSPTAPGAAAPPGSLDDAAVQAWLDSVWDAIPALYADLADTPLPGTQFLRDYAWHLDHVVLVAVTRGGVDAASEATQAAAREGRALTPQTGPLDAYALGLLLAANATVVDPAATDAGMLVRHLKGAAEGGVEAILEARAAIEAKQVPALEAYAGALADPSWIPAPPTPVPVRQLTLGQQEDAQEDEEDAPEDEGDEGEPTTDAPDAREAFLENVEAHGAGLARAALAVPVDALATNAASYHDALLAYAVQLQQSGALVPPVSPDAGYPARLRAWAEGEARAALGQPPEVTADRLRPDPDTALALAYLDGLARTAPWQLLAPPAMPVDALTAWAQAAAAAGLALACPTPDAPQECAKLGTGLGEGVGRALPHEAPTVPATVDEAAWLAALVEGAAEGLAAADRPAADPSVDASIVAGLVRGLPPGAPGTEAVAAAVAEAVAEHAARLPPGVPGALAEALAAALPAAPAVEAPALAEGAVLLVSGDPQATPANVQGRVRAFMAGQTQPSVSVADGQREAPGADLDGTPLLSALRGIRVQVVAPKADAGAWELAWSATDPRGADAKRVRLTASEGRLAGTLTAADLMGVPRGGVVRFVLLQTVGGQPVVHDRDGEPFALRADREAPTVTLDAPPASQGASFAVRWGGADDVAMGAFRVEVREGAGEWRAWLVQTTGTTATFTGEPGRAYRFRAIATDAAGHASAPSAERTVSVPASAAGEGPNEAPAVRFLTPEEGAVYADDFTVSLVASDPDGTEPQVRVCVWREDDVLDLACPHEGPAGAFTVDVDALPDGRFRLHAVATDGTRSTEADSHVFTLRRAPPALLGGSAQFDGTRGVLVLGAGPDVASAEATVRSAAGDTHEVRLRDDGKEGDARAGDGVWSAALRLAPGDWVATFVARGLHGQAATTEAAFRVEPDPAPPAPATGGGPAPDGESPPKARSPVPGAGLALVALAAVVALALRRRG